MRPSTFLISLNVLGLTYGAVSDCQKANNNNNACYKAVASSKPALATRKADCSAILRTHIDDSKTITSKIRKTVTTSTFWVAPTPENGQNLIPRRAVEPSNVAPPQITTTPDLVTGSDKIDAAILAPRDQYVVRGSVPTYARACKNIQEYATACLCYGFRAATTILAPQTRTTTITTSVVATSTILVRDIRYLQSQGQEFCTSYNSYAPPSSTQTVEVATTLAETVTITQETVYTTPVAVTITNTSPVAVPPIRRRFIQPADNEVLILGTIHPPSQGNSTARPTDYANPITRINARITGRDSLPVPTPASIVGWDARRISVACSRVATGTSIIPEVS